MGGNIPHKLSSKGLTKIRLIEGKGEGQGSNLSIS